MHRLYSTFAHGWPATGLLLMRLVSSLAIVSGEIARLRTGLSTEGAALHLFVAGTGILLSAGLWTPIVGTVITASELWRAYSQPGDPWVSILLGTMAAALAIVGPGAWSIDARLFGWRRIEIRNRER